jgi:hypothetical protein
MNANLHLTPEKYFQIYTIDNSPGLLCTSTQDVNNTNKLVPLTKKCATKTQEVLLYDIDVPHSINEKYNQRISEVMISNNIAKFAHHTSIKVKLSLIKCCLENTKF